MRFALSCLLAVPLAAAGAIGLILLPTGSPASDFFDLSNSSVDRDLGDAGARRSFAASQPLASAPPATSVTQSPAARPMVVAQAIATPVVVTGSVGSLGGSVATNGGAPLARTAGNGVPAATGSRTELARALQKELRRVGCYSGDISGDWNAASRQAMGSFLQRLNASLPTQEPDFILLTLVQGQTSSACAGPAPGPAPTLVQAPAPAQRVMRVESASTTSIPVAKAPASPPQWRTAVEVQREPSRNEPPRWVPTPEPRVVAAVPPLEERMSIGGPVDHLGAPDGSSQLSISFPNEGRAKPRTAERPAPHRTETRTAQSSQASQSRPHRDTSWTRNFFER